MATSVATPISQERLGREANRQERSFALLLVTGLTFFSMLVHGYHPYAEDGGVYVPEIKRLLDHGLYPAGAEFVVGHLRYSMFAPAMAGLVRASHLRVEIVLLAVHLASFWVTLFAAWLLAARCFVSSEARAGAVSLLAVWMTLPVAGTSLMLMDPYLTARSVSTPLVLLALVGMMEFRLPRFEAGFKERQRGLALCVAGVVGAGLMHPLMAAYGLGSVLLLAVMLSESRKVRVWGAAGLGATAVMVGAALQLLAPAENVVYQRVLLTRDYWFLSEWHWYELVGLGAPLAILSVVAWRQGQERDAARTGLARMAVAVGVIAIVVALVFARMGMGIHLVARMQPLRAFQIVYVVMTLMLGAALGERWLARRPIRWLVVFGVLGGVMWAAERRTFPASRHLELPGLVAAEAATSSTRQSEGGNEWEQAFVWIRENTPRDAMFAIDPQYITRDGEDAQGFRAITERSVLPDFSKDGGVVTNKPELAEEWLVGQRAQAGLDGEADEQRIAVLRPLGVTWVVLERRAATSFACDYANEAVKVCRLP